jgi:hypothetical protein
MISGLLWGDSNETTKSAAGQKTNLTSVYTMDAMSLPTRKCHAGYGSVIVL